ncbi:hypothetical protein N9948_01705 [bacterium]|nr:hypothetical protein [bacterium]
MNNVSELRDLLAQVLYETGVTPKDVETSVKQYQPFGTAEEGPREIKLSKSTAKRVQKVGLYTYDREPKAGDIQKRVGWCDDQELPNAKRFIADE